MLELLIVSLEVGLYEDEFHHSVRILLPNLVILIKLLKNRLQTLQTDVSIPSEEQTSSVWLVTLKYYQENEYIQ